MLFDFLLVIFLVGACLSCVHTLAVLPVVVHGQIPVLFVVIRAEGRHLGPLLVAVLHASVAHVIIGAERRTGADPAGKH